MDERVGTYKIKERRWSIITRSPNRSARPFMSSSSDLVRRSKIQAR